MNSDNFMTINEVSKLTGITIRALHYYDEIGLLSPANYTDAKYRLYSNEELKKLQQIMFFKEIGFELKKIKEIVTAPYYDSQDSLKKHRQMLLVKKNRLEELIELVDKTLNGENASFNAFDNSEVIALQEQYYEEVLSRWGNTKEFEQFNEKNKKMKVNEWGELEEKVKEIFTEMASYINDSPSKPEVQKLIARWQEFITENFYDCSNEILRCLGEMYVGDERFTKFFNSIHDNLAEFVNEAIKVYCNKK